MVIITLEELQVVINAQTSPFRRELNRVQTQLGNTTQNVTKQTSKMSKAFGLVAKAVALISFGKLALASTKVAMSVESSMDNIKANMGSSSKAFENWVNVNAKGFGMAKSEAYKYGSVFGNLLSVFSSSTKEVSGSTQKILEATGIIASKTGRTFEDTADRIRSGLLGSTEAIEDLGIYTNISMIESTEAFKRFAGSSSWAKLDFQTQQQIRLAAILEQTYDRYGDKLADTTQTRHAMFIASLKDMQLSLGQAFLPIYNAVLPALTTMANAIGTVLKYIAALSQALFGKATSLDSSASNVGDTFGSASLGTDKLNDSLGATGDTAKKTAKALKGLQGFDEINTLSSAGDDSAGGGGSGSGVGGVGSIGGIPDLDLGLDKTPDISGITEFADKIKEKVKGIVAFFKEHKAIILSVVAGLVAGISSFFLVMNWGAIVGAITSAFTTIATVIAGISLPVLAVAAVVALVVGAVVGAIVYLWQTSEEFRGIINGVISDVKELLNRLWESVLKPLFAFLKDVFDTILVPIAKFVGGVLVDVVLAVFKVLKSFWDNLLKPFVDFILDILVMALAGVFEIWEHWKPTIEKVMLIMKQLWDNVLKPFVDFLVAVLCKSFEDFGVIVKDVFDSVKVIFKGLIDFIVGVFTGDWDRAFQGVIGIFKGIFGGLAALVKTPMNAVIKVINGALDGINKIGFDIPDWVPGIGGKSFKVNIPNIPMLAKGGIVDSAQMFIAGESGKEVVMPLENNTGWITQLAEKVSTRMPQGPSSDRPIELTVKIGETTIGKLAIEGINALTKMNGSSGLII